MQVQELTHIDLLNMLCDGEITRAQYNLLTGITDSLRRLW